MKKLLLLFALISSISLFSQSYISPVGFNNSDYNRSKVIEYIKYDVKKSYSAIGMDDPSTLRMMEKENLDAFKQLLNAKDKSLLKNVEKQYCNIGMCNYTTILMMYNEQYKASNETLKW
jgi:hypothetical protein